MFMYLRYAYIPSALPSLFLDLHAIDIRSHSSGALNYLAKYGVLPIKEQSSHHLRQQHHGNSKSDQISNDELFNIIYPYTIGRSVYFGDAHLFYAIEQMMNCTLEYLKLNSNRELDMEPNTYDYHDCRDREEVHSMQRCEIRNRYAQEMNAQTLKQWTATANGSNDGRGGTLTPVKNNKKRFGKSKNGRNKSKSPVPPQGRTKSKSPVPPTRGRKKSKSPVPAGNGDVTTTSPLPQAKKTTPKRGGKKKTFTNTDRKNSNSTDVGRGDGGEGVRKTKSKSKGKGNGKENIATKFSNLVL